jgi:hypothetical protein
MVNTLNDLSAQIMLTALTLWIGINIILFFTNNFLHNKLDEIKYSLEMLKEEHYNQYEILRGYLINLTPSYFNK